MLIVERNLHNLLTVVIADSFVISRSQFVRLAIAQLVI